MAAAVAAAPPADAGAFPASAAEEAALLDALRTKYSTRTGAHSAPSPPISSAPASAEPAARLLACMGCQGSGAVAEPYGHRTLERPCPACGGEGTCTQRHGGSMQSSTGAPAPAATAAAADKLAAYQAELQEVKRGLAGCADSQELQLRCELAQQLERHVRRLQRRLGRLGG